MLLIHKSNNFMIRNMNIFLTGFSNFLPYNRYYRLYLDSEWNEEAINLQ